MSDTGPTTAGSIVGKLKIDSSEWDRELDEAAAKAHTLGASNPTIKVDAKVAEAIAKLEAVEAAQKALGLATERTRVSYLRLDEVQAKGTASAAKVAAAHLAASRAEDAEEKATRKLAAAKAALTVVQDVETASTHKANEANRTNVSRMGLIVAAVAVLIPLLGPLGAYAIGVAGSLGMMGVAGVFAVMGIKKAMEEGTKEGQEYSQGLRALKGDLDQLTRTGATAMLSQFRTTVRLIDQAMPSLNSQVGQFSKILGSTGNNLLAGLLNSLRLLNPLLVASGVYVESLARGFVKWTENGGVERFGEYALDALPQVVDTLGSLASMLMHVIEATAPIGAVTLGILTGLSDAIHGIPVEVLTVLVAGAGSAVLGFKAWGIIAPILATVAKSIGAVGIATQIATGPIGWITAAVSALAAILAVSVVSSQSAKVSMEDYTAAVEADTGKIGENVAVRAVQLLQDNDILSTAKRLGISVKTVTDATLGNARAQKELNAAIEKQLAPFEKKIDDSVTMTKAEWEHFDALNSITDAVKVNGEAMRGEAGEYAIRQEAINGVTAATNGLAVADAKWLVSVGEQNAAFIGLGSAYDSLVQKNTDVATATAAATESTSDSWTDYYDGFTIQLDQYIAELQAQVDAQNNWESNMITLSGRVSKGMLDELGKLGPEGAPLIAQLATASAEELAKLEPLYAEKAEAATGAFATKLSESQQVIAAAAAQLGQGAADEIAGKLASGTATVQTIMADYKLKVEGVVPTVDVATQAAKDKIQALRDLWSRPLPLMKGNGSMLMTSADSGGPGHANGGTVGHAGGGTVGGVGTSRSDSNVVRLSRGEEVIRESSASVVRPFLKAVNDNPVQAISNLQNAARATSKTDVKQYITTSDPMAAAMRAKQLFSREQAELAS